MLAPALDWLAPLSRSAYNGTAILSKFPIDEQKAKLFTEDEADASVLDDIRLALGRIADRSYGRCVVDEQPIDEKRLEALPWAKYCAKHQAELEATQGLRTPTL